ncbi:TPA: hypothetical protein ACQNTQ_001451 [Streptococcus pyogenes]
MQNLLMLSKSLQVPLE